LYKFENMSKDKVVETEIIPVDCIIDIRVKGEYVGRLNQYITDCMPAIFKDDAHRQEVMSHIKNGTNSEDPYVYHATTIIALYGMLELEAKAQKLTKTIVVDKETGEPVKQEESQQPPQS
jgi:hypothetical protein